MDPARDEIIISQLALLKKKERQQTLKKGVLFLGGLIVVAGVVFFIRFGLIGSTPTPEPTPNSPQEESISIEEITLPSPMLRPQQNGETSTSKVGYSTPGNGDSLDFASDSLGLRR